MRGELFTFVVGRCFGGCNARFTLTLFFGRWCLVLRFGALPALSTATRVALSSRTLLGIGCSFFSCGSGRICNRDGRFGRYFQSLGYSRFAHFLVIEVLTGFLHGTSFIFFAHTACRLLGTVALFGRG